MTTCFLYLSILSFFFEHQKVGVLKKKLRCRDRETEIFWKEQTKDIHKLLLLYNPDIEIKYNYNEDASSETYQNNLIRPSMDWLRSFPNSCAKNSCLTQICFVSYLFILFSLVSFCCV